MKDIRGKELIVGQTVHCTWIPQKDAPPMDILGTVVRTRGRGIKIVTDDGKEYTTEMLEKYEATVIIQESAIKQLNSAIQADEIALVNKLKALCWTGQLSKNFGSINIRIDM